MAQAFTLIQRQVLASNASSVQFTNIPQTYTDLKLVISARNTDTGNFGNILVSINGSSSSYVNQYLQGNGSGLGSGQVAQMVGDMNTTTSTTDTFNNIEVYFPNYAGSTQKQFSADSVAETNAATAYLMLMANTWNVTDAITSLTITNRTGGVSFVTNSTFTLYGIGGARASGGTITADARYTYHTFTSSGTFTALEKIKGAEVLCIAGGGGGGGQPDSGNSTGGGGAGGVLYTAGQLLSAGNSFTVVVGSGGSGGAAGANSGSKGSNSTFASLSAEGGGLGGHNANGGNGGSGGGGKSAGGTATSGQGNNGAAAGSNFQGGGGGGAGAAGSSNGDGGIGTTTYSSWSYATSTGVSSGGLYYLAGGGGGGQYFYTDGSGLGGLGGGGNGGRWNGSSVTAAVAGTANTGGGGGGAGSRDGQGTKAGGAGGSGLVIIRYPN